MTRLGIFGGSFDPVHNGHLLLAERCREACALDEVRFVPAGIAPHKADGAETDGATRAEMLELAISGRSEFRVDRRELERAGKSFTVDTLAEFAAELPERELFFLIGGDSLHDLPTWREPQRILELATIVAVNRGRETLTDVDTVLARIGDVPCERIQLVTMPAVDLSSTDIRHRVRNGDGIRYMLPRAVEALIADRGLYRSDSAD